LDLSQGDAATVSRLSCGVHTGTHVDAPAHFLEAGRLLHQIPLERWLGSALIVEIDHPDVITKDELVRKIQTPDIQANGVIERVLFKTRNSKTRWFEQPFEANFVHLQLDAAHWLIERGVKLIGIDYLSLEGFYSQGAPVHKALLSANVLILEGLYLADAPLGWVELMCLPMHLLNAEGAPARAIVRPR
ncbi:MAG: cyclase family protein, partial [Vampirovibrionales bacterium]|nr:cyclase family protein [Vampirovibrionales bacterium]